ncbi:MAG: uridine kinase [Polyangiaceae bacterium]|nr:uridine kinase [Polyangiaceae bacterium]
MTTLVIGVAGGSGSGKTTIARAIFEGLPPARVALLQHDSYYRDRPELSFEQRAELNYDHPSSLETELMVSHIDTLRRNQPIDVPVYDFAEHRRREDTNQVVSAPVIIVEGILVLAEKDIRDRLDIKLYVDTAADVRLMRRIRRDIEVRGRTFAQIRKQYNESVRPMHEAFVEPSKAHADIIIPEGGKNIVAVDLVMARVRQWLQQIGV